MLEDVTGTQKDDISAELDRLASTNDVELELAKMKQELTTGSGEAPKQIEGQNGEAVESTREEEQR